MGIDFRYCEARWAYSGFHRFRSRLAKEIGIDLKDMHGFGGTRSFHTISNHIKYLLDHSDCDGTLEPYQCKVVAKSLKKLIANWANDDYDKVKGLLLVEGLEYCASKNRHLVFI
jgi:hypothetical protein